MHEVPVRVGGPRGMVNSAAFLAHLNLYGTHPWAEQACPSRQVPKCAMHVSFSCLTMPPLLLMLPTLFAENKVMVTQIACDGL